jgi:hypothetical protein
MRMRTSHCQPSPSSASSENRWKLNTHPNQGNSNFLTQGKQLQAQCTQRRASPVRPGAKQTAAYWSPHVDNHSHYTASRSCCTANAPQYRVGTSRVWCSVQGWALISPRSLSRALTHSRYKPHMLHGQGSICSGRGVPGKPQAEQAAARQPPKSEQAPAGANKQ